MWRKEFGTDDLPRTFEYTEKAQVFEYYPQYYHKTDKVSNSPVKLPGKPTSHPNAKYASVSHRTADRSTLNSWAK